MREVDLKTRKKYAQKGATLVMVLVIMLAGMALLGAAFYMHGSFVGRATASIGRTEQMNNMDAAIEKGKILLDETIKKNSDFPKASWKEKNVRSIDHVSDLLVYDGNYPLEIKSDGIEVVIYDLDYDSGDITSTVPAHELNRIKSTLPPAMKIGDTKYHAFLIKATRSRDDGLKDVVEVAIKAYNGN